MPRSLEFLLLRRQRFGVLTALWTRSN